MNLDIREGEWNRNGRVVKNVIERFLSRTRRAKSGCLLWTGPKAPGKDRGEFAINPGTKMSPSRFSYLAFVGPVDGGMFVCHKCDNPMCVEPSHLYAGTQKDNRQDASARSTKMRKSKQGLPYGVRNPPKGRTQYSVQVSFYGKPVHLGCFRTIEEAAAVAAKAKAEWFSGKGARP